MDEFVRYLCTKCINEKVEIARSIGAEGACKNSQVKGQRQTKNTFEKKVFLPAFLVPKMGNGHEKQADSEGGKNK